MPACTYLINHLTDCSQMLPKGCFHQPLHLRHLVWLIVPCLTNLETLAMCSYIICVIITTRVAVLY